MPVAQVTKERYQSHRREENHHLKKVLEIALNFVPLVVGVVVVFVQNHHQHSCSDPYRYNASGNLRDW